MANFGSLQHWLTAGLCWCQGISLMSNITPCTMAELAGDESGCFAILQWREGPLRVRSALGDYVDKLNMQ